jgi:DNA-binding transcriptional LysR family regulator
MNVNFELYKVFYFCAKNSNFSKAAKELFVTQSSVSQSIKKLENEMNIKLFYRTGKNISLSKEGEILFMHIEKAYNIIKSGEKNIESIKSMNNGEIYIGASDTLTKYYLMPTIKKFYKKYPNIKIKLANNSSPENIKMVKDKKVDFGIININPHNKYQGITTDVLWTSKNIFVYSTNHYFFKDTPINLIKLNEYTLLTLEKNSSSRKVFDKFISNSNIKFDFDLEFGTTSLIIEMAIAGIGIAYVSKDAVEDLIKKKILSQINICENIPSINIGLVVNNEFPLSLASKKFIEFIKMS